MKAQTHTIELEVLAKHSRKINGLRDRIGILIIELGARILARKVDLEYKEK